MAWVAAAILVVSVPVFLLGFSSITGSIVGGYEKANLLKITSAIGIVLGLVLLALSKFGGKDEDI